MRQDVDGLIVKVKKATETPPHGQQRPVPGENVRIELQMPWHVLPVEQVSSFPPGAPAVRPLGQSVVLCSRQIFSGRLQFFDGGQHLWAG